MRHRVAGKQLSRTTAHRKAMRRNLAASLFEHGAVRTTVAKAKEVRPFVEKLITIARQGTLHARRRVIALLQDRAMVDKDDPGQLLDKTVVGRLFDEVAPRYADRPGGYTRIIRLPERRIGDAGKQVLLQLVEETSAAGKGGQETTRSTRRKRAARRAEAAKTTAVAEAPAPAEPEGADESPADDAQEPDGDDQAGADDAKQ